MNINLGLLFGALILFSNSSLIIASDFSTAEPGTSKKTTTVYKINNPDGSVSYSDQPAVEAQKMEVEPVTTIPAIDINQSKIFSSTTKRQAPIEYYRELEIVSPANGAVFHSGNGNIPVTVLIRPRLKSNDTFVLLLDGQVMATQQEVDFQLSHVDRGTHTLLIKIVDPDDTTVKSMASEFTLLRPRI